MSQVCKSLGTIFLLATWFGWMLWVGFDPSWLHYTLGRGVLMAAVAAAFFLGALAYRDGGK